MNEIEARVAARLAEQMARGWYERTLEVTKERDAARAELAEARRRRCGWSGLPSLTCPHCYSADRIEGEDRG